MRRGAATPARSIVRWPFMVAMLLALGWSEWAWWHIRAELALLRAGQGPPPSDPAWMNDVDGVCGGLDDTFGDGIRGDVGLDDLRVRVHEEPLGREGPIDPHRLFEYVEREPRLVAQATTGPDPRGRFHFTDLPSRPHRLAVMTPRGTVWRLRASDPWRGRRDPYLALRLDTWGVLSGVVRDPDDHPVAAATVLVRRADPGASPFVVSGRTDAHGAFELLCPPEGPLVIAVFARGRAPVVRRVEQGTGEVHIPVVGGGGIGGRVLDHETGAPLAGVVVTARAVDGVAWGESVTRPDGRFDLDGFPRGSSARVSARAAGMWSVSEPIVRVPDDGRAASLELRLVPSGVVEGRVADPDGRPLRGVAIGVRTERPLAPDTMPRTETDAAGRYRLTDVPPGRFVVLAADDLFVQRTEGEAAAGVLAAGARVAVAPIALDRGVRVMGQILDQGRTVRQARVAWRDAQGRTLRFGDAELLPVAALDRADLQRQAFVDFEARFTLYGVPRSPAVTLEVSHPDYDLRLRVVVDTSAGDVSDLELEFSRAAWIGGRVLDPSGEPVPGACVRYVPDDARWQGGTYGWGPDASPSPPPDVARWDGSYRIWCIPGRGRLTVTTDRPDLLPPPPLRVALFSGGSTPVDLRLESR